jgi:hypothetical protein
MTSTQHNSPHGPGIPGPGRPVVLDSGPAGLIAAVPGLLGFTPTASVVLVGLSYHGGELESIGPVVRTDLFPDAAAAGADALCGAVYDLPDARAAVIVVEPHPWPVGGRTVETLATVLCEFRDNAVDVSGIYVTESMRDGGLWREIVPSGHLDRWHIRRRGTLDDPRVSPILSAGQTTVHDAGGTSEAMDRELDPVDDAVRTGLPASWSTGADSGTARDSLSPADICALVAQVSAGMQDADEAAPLHRARCAVRRALTVHDTAERVFAFCTSVRLFPSLVTVAAGGGATVVMALLLEVAALGRCSLRSRALLLIAVLGWCGNHGALGHRAARRCLQETAEDSGVGRLPGVNGDTEQLGDDLLTMSLAGILWDGVSDGSAARAVRSILDQGLAQLNAVAVTAPPANAGGDTAMVEKVLDRQAVTAVRNALGRRAGK